MIDKSKIIGLIEQNLSYAEVGRKTGLSREYVRQIHTIHIGRMGLKPDDVRLLPARVSRALIKNGITSINAAKGLGIDKLLSFKGLGVKSLMCVMNYKELE